MQLNQLTYLLVYMYVSVQGVDSEIKYVHANMLGANLNESNQALLSFVNRFHIPAA